MTLLMSKSWVVVPALVAPEGQWNMALIKVGNMITAVITDAVAISVEPAS